MIDLSPDIARLALRLIEEDPNKEFPLDVRKSALSVAAHILEQEIARQTTLTMAAKILGGVK